MRADSEVIGSIFGGYEITAVLGRGGMGVVYKARDVKLERDVALKVMDPLLARDDVFMKRFWSEAKALARLQNLNIVSVYTLIETELGVCIVMEYVNGATLAEIIKTSGPLPLKRIFHLFDQILQAFEHAHSSQIVHRDVKPSNILVTGADIVKVADFGLAKIYQHSSLTVSNISGGTIYYASPEQLEGLSRVDNRGDIYSIGMTMYEALTARIPFQPTDSDFSIRERIVKGKIPPPRTMRPDVPEEVNSIVMKAIAKDPGHRFQSAGDMRAALARVTSATQMPSGKRLAFPTKVLVPSVVVLILVIAAVILYPVIAPERGRISIITVPLAASVIINGDSAGLTPLHDYSVPPGPVSLRIMKPDYQTRDTTLVVVRDQSLLFTTHLNGLPVDTRVDIGNEKALAEARPRAVKKESETARTRPGANTTSRSKPRKEAPKVEPGAIAVTSDTPGALVWIDEIVADHMPYPVQPGDHQLRVSAGSNRWLKKVSVASGKTLHLSVDFTTQVHVTVVAFAPDGTPVRGARIIVDGVPHTKYTPAEIILPLGLHTVAVQHEGYADAQPVVRNFEKDIAGDDALRFTLVKK